MIITHFRQKMHFGPFSQRVPHITIIQIVFKKKESRTKESDIINYVALEAEKTYLLRVCTIKLVKRYTKRLESSHRYVLSIALTC